MREFNRLINTKKLSNLKTFKIESARDVKLFDALETLIAIAENQESGQTFELFDQKFVSADSNVMSAKQYLIDVCNAEKVEHGETGGLSIATLFRLQFVVTREGHKPDSFQRIDGAASTGTVIMAKLVTGLAMLNIMMQKKYDTQVVCYLDEAKTLDRENHKSLIAVARSFGFNIIFASTEPLDTVDCCVPVRNHKGENYITEKNWQILKEKSDESPIASGVT